MFEDGEEMREDCFAYEREEKEDEGYRWSKERCIATTNKSCEGCAFYKPRKSPSKHIYYIFQTKITEWIPK